jgi:Fic family protein
VIHWQDASSQYQILYYLEKVTRERTLAIRALMTETTEKARLKLPARVYSKELIETIFRQPHTKGEFLVEAGIAKRQTASEYLKELERIGVLEAHKIGKETLYLNVDLVWTAVEITCPYRRHE